MKELFSGAALRQYLADRGNQRAEYTALDDEFVSNYDARERIRIFVDVELPIRTILRSDGHEPNLPDTCYGSERSIFREHRRSCKAAVEAKYPEKCVDLGVKVMDTFEKRGNDVVSTLCLAACTALPRHVYMISSPMNKKVVMQL